MYMLLASAAVPEMNPETNTHYKYMYIVFVIQCGYYSVLAEMH